MPRAHSTKSKRRMGCFLREMLRCNICFKQEAPAEIVCINENCAFKFNIGKPREIVGKCGEALARRASVLICAPPVAL